MICLYTATSTCFFVCFDVLFKLVLIERRKLVKYSNFYNITRVYNEIDI